MSKLRQLNSNFLWLASSVILVTGTAIGFSLNPLQGYVSNRAQALITAGDRGEPSSPQQSIVEYRLAEILDPKSGAVAKAVNLYLKLDQPDDAILTLKRHPSPTSNLQIADIQFRSGKFTKALQTLEQLDSTDSAVATLKIRTLLELDQPSHAISASTASSSQTSALLIGLAQLVAGNAASTKALISSLGSVETTETLQRASSHNTNLAKVLYSNGLLKSSERVLKSQLDNSEAYLLLAQIKLASRQPTKADLADACDALQKGLAMDPANLALHQLLADVSIRIGDSAAAEHERKLIDQLQTGK